MGVLHLISTLPVLLAELPELPLPQALVRAEIRNDYDCRLMGITHARIKLANKFNWQNVNRNASDTRF